MSNVQKLSSGIFWVLTDDINVGGYRFISFNIPCDIYGVPLGEHEIPLNSKNGLTYNHKAMWEMYVRNNPLYRPYNKKAYDYYPRGRVQIANNKADIYLNFNIHQSNIVDEVKTAFGLYPHNIADVRVVADNSAHYQCWIDRSDE